VTRDRVSAIRRPPNLIVSWKAQYPPRRGAHKVHLTTGSTLDRVIRALVFRDAFVQPSLHRTGGVRAFEEERSHCADKARLPAGGFELTQFYPAGAKHAARNAALASSRLSGTRQFRAVHRRGKVGCQ
jgi:hypothetical protein